MNQLQDTRQDSGLKLEKNRSLANLALMNAANNLAQQGLARPRLKTKDVVGYLLAHGARAWRASFPVAKPRVKAIMPNGNLAVRIKLNVA